MQAKLIFNPAAGNPSGNITKSIKMAASSNLGNMFSVARASAFPPFLPMLPIQVLTNTPAGLWSRSSVKP